MSEMFKGIMDGIEDAIDIMEGKSKPAYVSKAKRIEVQPIIRYSSMDIVHLRHTMNLTQASFGDILGVSHKTVEAWERGENAPNPSAMRFMNILKQDPGILQRLHIV